MAKKKKKSELEELVVPPQNMKICGTIFLCQMIAVLSCVSIVYLTVAIYVPSLKAFQSGINEHTVMCTTVKVVAKDNCDWGSCGEWCLSKTSGMCLQIYVNLRKNGSSLFFTNCTNTANKTCYGIRQENVKKSRCIADECKNLTGTFNCTDGTCINITDAFECFFSNTETPLKCSGRRGKINCMALDGLYDCDKGICERIRTPYNCDRRCVDIPTRNKNVIILSGDRVFLSRCEKGFITLESNESQEIWSSFNNKIVMTSCYEINDDNDSTISAIDCINGTLLANSSLSDLTNFTYLSYLSYFNSELLDESGLIAPIEQNLILSNESKLLINLEGCVNTLQDECKAFIREYGKDGTDHNAKARFPCFYSDNDKELVVARFNLNTTYKQFLIAFFLPITLLIVSTIILLFFQKNIVVGDDSRMRIKTTATKKLLKNQSVEELHKFQIEMSDRNEYHSLRKNHQNHQNHQDHNENLF